MSSLKKTTITLIFLFIITNAIYSHPHTFIDAKIECEFNKRGLKGFWIDWSFDQMFTSSIIMDYDLDRNGEFSKAEILDIKENAFSNLINYNYFIYIIENKSQFRPETVTDFTAAVNGDDILYRFFVPYSSISLEKGNKVILAIYDETFFCDIAIKSASTVKNKNTENYNTELVIRKNKEKTITYNNSFQTITRDGAVYSGFVNPKELVLRFTQK